MSLKKFSPQLIIANTWVDNHAARMYKFPPIGFIVFDISEDSKDWWFSPSWSLGIYKKDCVPISKIVARFYGRKYEESKR